MEKPKFEYKPAPTEFKMSKEAIEKEKERWLKATPIEVNEVEALGLADGDVVVNVTGIQSKYYEDMPEEYLKMVGEFEEKVGKGTTRTSFVFTCQNCQERFVFSPEPYPESGKAHYGEPPNWSGKLSDEVCLQKNLLQCLSVHIRNLYQGFYREEKES